jgi:hypothetical protein
MSVSAVQRILIVLAALLGSLLVAGAAAATTTSEAAVFTYDVQTNERVTVHEFEDVDSGTAHLGSQQDRSASSDVDGWGTSTTPARSFIATEAGPVALNAGSEVSQWAGPTLSRVTQTEETMYRVWGGGSGRAGEWLTPINPASSAAARAGLALPEGNAATYVSEVLVPAGTRIQVGVAGEAVGQAGGWTQVRLLQQIPLSSFGKGVPLAP